LRSPLDKEKKMKKIFYSFLAMLCLISGNYGFAGAEVKDDEFGATTHLYNTELRGISMRQPHRVERDEQNIVKFWIVPDNPEELDLALKFLQLGYDVRLKAFQNMTLLMIAAQKGAENNVKLLLKKGADIEATAEDGSTVFHALAYLKDKAKLERIFELLQEHATKGLSFGDANKKMKLLMNQQAKFGVSPLHKAVQNDNFPYTELLVYQGADQLAKTSSDAPKSIRNKTPEEMGTGEASEYIKRLEETRKDIPEFPLPQEQAE